MSSIASTSTSSAIKEPALWISGTALILSIGSTTYLYHRVSDVSDNLGQLTSRIDGIEKSVKEMEKHLSATISTIDPINRKLNQTLESLNHTQQNNHPPKNKSIPTYNRYTQRPDIPSSATLPIVALQKGNADDSSEDEDLRLME